MFARDAQPTEITTLCCRLTTVDDVEENSRAILLAGVAVPLILQGAAGGECVGVATGAEQPQTNHMIPPFTCRLTPSPQIILWLELRSRELLL